VTDLERAIAFATEAGVGSPDDRGDDVSKTDELERLWRQLHTVSGQLTAICDDMPKGRHGVELRAVVDEGWVELTALTREALLEAGVEPNMEATAGHLARGYQTVVLLRREEDTGAHDVEAWRQDPREFMRGLALERAAADRRGIE
jgi:hypothetical protein